MRALLDMVAGLFGKGPKVPQALLVNLEVAFECENGVRGIGFIAMRIMDLDHVRRKDVERDIMEKVSEEVRQRCISIKVLRYKVSDKPTPFSGG